MSDVPQFVVHRAQDERVRCTREGALRILEADVIVLVDETRDYQECIKGRDRLEAITRSGEALPLRVLRVAVDSQTDDVERMMAVVDVVTAKNPTGQPPYLLPEEADDDDQIEEGGEAG